MKNIYRVLLVEDEDDNSKLIERTLSHYGGEIEFKLSVARTFTEAIELVGKYKIDMIILDLILPDSNGTEVIQDFNRLNPQIPIVVLTGVEDERVAMDAISKGAADYILKRDFHRSSLPRVIKYAVEREYAFERLRQNKESIANMFAGRNSATYQCEFDRFWTMRSISKSIYNITGYNSKDFLNNNELAFCSIIHPDDILMVGENISKQIEKDEMYEVNYRIIDKTGKVKWILDCGNCEMSKDQVKCLNGILVDVTSLKNSFNINDPKDSYVFESKDVSFSLCDDISDVIKLIKQTNLEILNNRSNFAESGKLKNNLFLADSLLNKINGMLRGSSIDETQTSFELEYEHFCLIKVLKKLLDELVPRAAAKGLNLFASMPDECLKIDGDRNLLEKMFENLILSFIDFSSSSGGNIYLYVNQIEDDVRVDIQINRSVIDGDMLYQLVNLDDFENNLNPNIGSNETFRLIKDIVEVHNGRLWVEADVNNCCGLSLQLPLIAMRHEENSEEPVNGESFNGIEST